MSRFSILSAVVMTCVVTRKTSHVLLAHNRPKCFFLQRSPYPLFGFKKQGRDGTAERGR